ncbi:hypothetical protein BJV82DRAFT_583963 [Fennellomyces sp. T-0311]|nr:hypothetical protein BJV82DRAFT_583963 [Fennellomyces sp. T-0311]
MSNYYGLEFVKNVLGRSYKPSKLVGRGDFRPILAGEGTAFAFTPGTLTAMPCPSKRRSAAKDRQNRKTGRYVKKEESISDDDTVMPVEIVPNDWELLDLTDDQVQQAAVLPVVWTENEGSNLRGVYTRDSDVTRWRRKKESEAAASMSNKLTTYGFTSSQKEPDNAKALRAKEKSQKQAAKEEEHRAILDAYNELTVLVKQSASAQSSFNQTSTYQMCRVKAVYKYFEYRLQSKRKIEASELATAVIDPVYRVSTFRSGQ